MKGQRENSVPPKTGFGMSARLLLHALALRVWGLMNPLGSVSIRNPVCSKSRKPAYNLQR